MNLMDIIKPGTTTEDLRKAIVATTNEQYPELQIKEDDPRVTEHVERVQEFLRAYWKV